MTSEVARVVALGASNLTLGLETAISTARAAFGPSVEVLVANGYGRSYGAVSSIAGRALPGILQSGLWKTIERLEPVPTRAIIMDVGNDVLYRVPPARILEWVDEAAGRLLAHTRDVVITDLPVDSVRRLSPAGFLFFRSLFFPPCRLSRDEAFARVVEVNEGILRLADRRGLRLARLRPNWYGFDPIHFRPACWSAAWGDIVLGAGARPKKAAFSAAEWVSLHARPPEERWWFGLRGGAPQSGRPLRRGGRLWLF